MLCVGSFECLDHHALFEFFIRIPFAVRKTMVLAANWAFQSHMGQKRPLQSASIVARHCARVWQETKFAHFFLVFVQVQVSVSFSCC